MLHIGELHPISIHAKYSQRDIEKKKFIFAFVIKQKNWKEKEIYMAHGMVLNHISRT